MQRMKSQIKKFADRNLKKRKEMHCSEDIAPFLFLICFSIFGNW